jgi:6,7-dimethyl-8-ribityllumazine synthase
MYRELGPSATAAGLRVAVAVSRYHAEITASMRDSAVRRFGEAGGRPEDLLVVGAPGSFELTAVCRALAARGDLDAIVALGCVISGETPHDQYIASAVAHGLTEVTLRTGVPVAFGVLTCRSVEQARARCGGGAARGDKGAEAMAAAIEAATVCRAIGEKMAGRS